MKKRNKGLMKEEDEVDEEGTETNERRESSTLYIYGA